MTILMAMYEVEAAVFAAAEKRDIFHEIKGSIDLINKLYYRGARSLGL